MWPTVGCHWCCCATNQNHWWELIYQFLRQILQATVAKDRSVWGCHNQWCHKVQLWMLRFVLDLGRSMLQCFVAQCHSMLLLLWHHLCSAVIQFVIQPWMPVLMHYRQISTRLELIQQSILYLRFGGCFQTQLVDLGYCCHPSLWHCIHHLQHQMIVFATHYLHTLECRWQHQYCSARNLCPCVVAAQNCWWFHHQSTLYMLGPLF